MKSLHPWASRSSRRASWEKLLNKAPYFLSDSRAHRMDGHIWPSWGLYVASKCWRARLVGGCLGRVAAFPRRNKLFTNFKLSQEHITLVRTLGFSLKKNDLVIKSLLCIISKYFDISHSQIIMFIRFDSYCTHDLPIFLSPGVVLALNILNL